MPKRIQRKRTKGWRMPENTVSVTRPGAYGNPFAIGHRYAKGDSFLEAYGKNLDDGLVTTENCLIAFRAYCEKYLDIDPQWLEPLRGKDLACWCKEGAPCHADILLELANVEIEAVVQ